VVDALVSRLVLEKNIDGSVIAKAVEFENDDKTYTVNVGKEVILSAGCLCSTSYVTVVIYLTSI
jgi:hypothetical protein